MRFGFGLVVVSIAACNGHHAAGDAHGDGVALGCGNGVRDGTEQCDGTDLGGATCATAGAPGWVGILACSSTCQFDIAGCNPPPTTWSSMTDATQWSTFDVTTLFPGARGFTATVFDGRYLYFPPNSNANGSDGIVARYDTQGGFGSSGSWQTFDVATVNAAAKGFQGGAFDGRYVYLVPYNSGTSGTIARFDTQAAGGFGASASWSTFDITTVTATAHGFVRAAFDGRYLYLAPHYNGTAYHGVAARYDTQSDFASASSWATFDIASAFPTGKGFLGAEFDGRYIYYVPYYNGTAYHGLVPRFDTQAAGGFADAASWSSFDLQAVNGSAVGFYGVAFDGQYMYLSQYYNGALGVSSHYGGVVARYDTHGAFSAASWQTFDLQSVNGGAAGFIGAMFDGRFVYLSPYYNGAYDGVVARLDTTAATFAAGASWQFFNIATVNGGATGYQGVGFDGEYIYLSPSYNTGGYHGIVARFSAKSPSWLPRDWNRSFD